MEVRCIECGKLFYRRPFAIKDVKKFRCKNCRLYKRNKRNHTKLDMSAHDKICRLAMLRAERIKKLKKEKEAIE